MHIKVISLVASFYLIASVLAAPTGSQAATDVGRRVTNGRRFASGSYGTTEDINSLIENAKYLKGTGGATGGLDDAARAIEDAAKAIYDAERAIGTAFRAVRVAAEGLGRH